MDNNVPPIICKNAEIKEGKVSIGHGCVIHPYAKIIIEGDCSIVFGEYNIIEENVVIKATPRFNPLLNNNETITVYIGNFNHFKVGCYIENTSIENYNVFDYGSSITESYVESKCIITPAINIQKRSTVKANSIVLDNQITKNNTMFNEANHIKFIKELYKLLSELLTKHNKIHNIDDT
jgi:carbonic anhydrase/acetyltransferase-like protein (isoleucine patch superfamily)